MVIKKVVTDDKIRQEDQEYLKKNIGVVQKLQGNIKAINQYRKLYNTLCDDCKKKVIKNPRMALEDYCEPCQNKARYRMQKVKEMIK